MVSDEHDKIDRGERAARLLEDPLLVEALGALEGNALARLKSADVNDEKTLRTLVMGLQACSGLRRRLELVVRDGREALDKLDKQSDSTLRRALRRII